MIVTPDQARLQEPAISPEDAKLWRDRWRQAAEMDRQLRAAAFNQEISTSSEQRNGKF